MNEVRREVITAHHEAGHVVIAYHRGLPMLGADILESGERRGVVHMDEPPRNFDAGIYGAMEAWYFGQMMLGMAGIQAVEILTGRPPDQIDPNLQQVGGSDWATLGTLAGELSSDDLQKAHDETKRILLDNWHAVEAVAAALLEHRTLEKATLYTVLEETGCSRDVTAVKEVENAYQEAEYEQLCEQRFKLAEAIQRARAESVPEIEALDLEREFRQTDERIVELGGESWLRDDDPGRSNDK